RSPKLPGSPLTPKSNRKNIAWEELDVNVLESLRTLSRTMYKTEGLGGMPAAFGHFDKGGKGYFGREEFIDIIRSRYDVPCSDEHAAAMFEAVDSNGSGRVNYIEFLNAFQITDSRASGRDDWRS